MLRNTKALTAAENIDIGLREGNALLVQLTGTGAPDGTVDFQGTIDGLTYTNTPYVRKNSITAAKSVAQLSSITTATTYILLPPLTQVRIAVAALTSGTITVVYREIEYYLPLGEQGVSARGTTTLHRDAITAVDKLAAPVAMTSGATAATGGSLAASTTYNMVASAYNRWGVTAVPAVLGQATGAGAPSTHVVKGTLAQVTGADGYDLFMGTPAAPLWVDRITEAERASANGVEITAVGTHQAGAALGAGVIQFNVVGTGVASTSANFAQNNAYTPAAAGITAIDCSGYEKMMVMVKLALTDLRSAPSLSIVPFVRNELSTDDWHADSIGILSLLGALGQPLVGELALDVRAAANVKLLIDTIAGQGAAASIWYALTR